MNNWIPKKVGDISDSCLGKMLDKEKNKGTLHPYLSNKCVRWGGFDFNFTSLMKFESHEHERFGLKYGDIIVCEGGEPGRSAIWRNEIPNMKIQKALHRIRVKKGYSNEFLYYRFLLAGKTGALEKYFIGSTIKHLTGVNLKRIEFTFPPFLQQYKIAKVLSDLDAKIELNNRINAELEAMAKLVYEYWFVQFDFPISAEQATKMGDPTLEGKPYKSSGGKMVWDEVLKREIPEGWEVKNIYKCSNVQYGYPFKTKYFNEKSGVPVIRIRDILDNTISNFSLEPNIDPKYKIKIGDLLVGMDGHFHINYWSNPYSYLNQRVVKIGETFLSSMYLRYAIEPFIKLREKSVSRTTVGHLSDKDIRSIFVLIPTQEILKKSNSFFKSNLEKLIKNRIQNKELSSLRDWLLPMLMNGQVTVAEAEEQVEGELGMVAEKERFKYSLK